MKRLQRADRDQLVSVQRAVVTNDDAGVAGETWTEIDTAWTKMIWGTGAERREAGAIGASVTVTFQTAATPLLRELTERDRIVDRTGRVWNITSVADRGRAELEVTATSLAR